MIAASLRIKNTIPYALSAALFLGTAAYAAENAEVSAFRSFKDIGAISAITVPTVIEVPLGNEPLGGESFAVLEEETETYQPYYLNVQTTGAATSVTAQGMPSSGSMHYLLDRNFETAVTYDLPEEGVGAAQVTLTAARPISSSVISLILAPHVAPPVSVELRAVTQDGEKIIVAKKSFPGQMILFPETTASVWRLTLTYAQPLRIVELELQEKNVSYSVTRGLRFLARPGKTYRVYFNPDRYTAVPSGEAGNLRDGRDVLMLPAVPTRQNSAYIKADVDEDGIPDEADNCVETANPDQEDVNGNYRGDACEDFDRDGIPNVHDNCSDQPNANQRDTDGDGVGDACDAEESRVTERMPWLPWAGMGIAFIVVMGLFVITLRGIKGKGSDGESSPPAA